MSKKVLQDVVKIKNIKRIEKKPEIFSPSNSRNKRFISNVLPSVSQKNNTSNNMLWFVALISIVFLFFAISFLFSSATITINPKTKDFILDKTFTASKDANTDDLSYDLVVLSGEESKTFLGGEEKDYLQPAQGSVLVYNAFSSLPQSLSMNTRLEGSNGKIYKTKNKITIPGMTKNGIPGKIGVDIYAENAGEEYNSDPLDFKMLGFKGTSKYSKFYARSVGEIKGGLKGKSRQINENEKEKDIKELKDVLFAKLFQKAKDQTPKDFILLKDATFLDIDEQNETSADSEGNITLSIKGTFNGVLFNKQNLEKEIIIAILEKNDENVYISNIEDLSFSYPNKELIALDDLKNIVFNLSGNTKIVWKVDQNKIVEDLLGKNKKEFNQILSQYQNIVSASSIIKPVWKNSFPTKSKDIKVIVNYPN